MNYVNSICIKDSEVFCGSINASISILIYYIQLMLVILLASFLSYFSVVWMYEDFLSISLSKCYLYNFEICVLEGFLWVLIQLSFDFSSHVKMLFTYAFNPSMSVELCDLIIFSPVLILAAYGAGYGTMSGAATSQYGVASTTAIAGQTPPTGAGGAASATDYTAFGQLYGDESTFIIHMPYFRNFLNSKSHLKFKAAFIFLLPVANA